MKNVLFVSVILIIFSGASLSARAQKSVKFIDGIEINPEPVNYNIATPTQDVDNTVAIKASYKPFTSINILFTEQCKSLQFKYAQILNREVELLSNNSLFKFIDEWWQTHYRFGGTTRAGIDCSAFAGLLLSTVYAIKLPRTAREQYRACFKIDKENMQEGDMVFFNTTGGVSHVGVYLGDGYFVHASVSNGVTISRLDDDYYRRKFIGGGRPLTEMAKVNLN